MAERELQASDQPLTNEKVVYVSSGSLECPLEADNTLTLATLQSQFPGARGLWYISGDTKARRAIRYDPATNKFMPPKDDWGDRMYYLTFCESNVVSSCIGSNLPVLGECRHDFICPHHKQAHSAFEKDPLKDSGHDDFHVEMVSECLTDSGDLEHTMTNSTDNASSSLDWKGLKECMCLRRQLQTASSRIEAIELVLHGKQRNILDEFSREHEIRQELEKEVKRKTNDIENLTKKCEYLNQELLNLRHYSKTTPSSSSERDHSHSEQLGSNANLMSRSKAVFDENKLVQVPKLQPEVGVKDERDMNEENIFGSDFEPLIGQANGGHESCQNPHCYGLETRSKELEELLEERTMELEDLRRVHIQALEEKVKAQTALEEQVMEIEKAKRQIERAEVPESMLRTGQPMLIELNAKFMSAKVLCKELETQLCEKEALIKELNVKLAFAEIENQKTEERLDDFETSFTRMVEQLATSTEELDKSRTAYSEMEILLSEKVKSLKAMEDAKNELEANMDGLQKETELRRLELVADLEKKCFLLEQVQNQLNSAQVDVQRLDKSFNDTKWRCGELEADVGRRDEEILYLKNIIDTLSHERSGLKTEVEQLANKCNEQSAELSRSGDIVELEKRVSDLSSENERLKVQLDTHYKHARNPPQYQQDRMSEKKEYEELSSELYKIHQRKYSMEKEMGEMQMELSSYQQSHIKMLEERKKFEGELYFAAEQERKLQWRIGELEAENRSMQERIRYLESNAPEAQRQPGLMAHQEGDDEWQRFAALEEELNETKGKLNDANDKVKWYLGEADHFRREMENKDARILWLESELNRVHNLLNELKSSDSGRSSAEVHQLHMEIDALKRQLHEEAEKRRWYEGEKDHFKWEFETCAKRCQELQILDDCFNRDIVRDGFLVNKEPYHDRERWLLCKWNTVAQQATERVLFEIHQPAANVMFLCLSCFNWECSLMMHKRDDGTWYLWVDIPRGRHEFRFVQLGNWCTSGNYGLCANDYGSENNWLVVQ